MTYRGTIHNGVVELEPGTKLPEGSVVEVRPASPQVNDEANPPDQTESPFDKYAELAQDADLPSDFAAQHGHYIHGTPKR